MDRNTFGVKKEINFQLRHALTGKLERVLEKVQDALIASQHVLKNIQFKICLTGVNIWAKLLNWAMFRRRQQAQSKQGEGCLSDPGSQTSSHESSIVFEHDPQLTDNEILTPLQNLEKKVGYEKTHHFLAKLMNCRPNLTIWGGVHPNLRKRLFSTGKPRVVPCLGLQTGGYGY